MMTVDNHHIYISLRKSFPVFTYHGYDMVHEQGRLRIKYHFSAGDIYHFKPSLDFTPGVHDIQSGITPELDNFVFNLGLIEMLSYWKAFCSPRIVIKEKGLNTEQSKWWKKLYLWGLGEFFFTNGIPIPGGELVEFECRGGSSVPKGSGSWTPDAHKVLVPVGGGKDSAVCIELLKNTGMTIIPYVVNPRGATDQVLKAANPDGFQAVVLNREIDPLLLSLNKKGFLNGHTPFSAMLAFSSVLTAFICGIQHISLSNESSANEPSVPGSKINHQYSKSLEFEKDFRKYTQSFLHGHINYFSLLRPLNEIQISALFSGYTHYHDVFKSCNVASKKDMWCGQCPKCLFTWIMLSPFVSPTRLRSIFGKDISEDISLTTTLDQLTGLADIKPFECVGTIEEVNVALVHVIKKMTLTGGALPALLHYYKTTSLYSRYKESNIDQLLLTSTGDHCLHEKFDSLIHKSLASLADKSSQWTQMF